MSNNYSRKIALTKNYNIKVLGRWRRHLHSRKEVENYEVERSGNNSFMHFEI